MQLHSQTDPVSSNKNTSLTIIPREIPTGLQSNRGQGSLLRILLVVIFYMPNVLAAGGAGARWRSCRWLSWLGLDLNYHLGQKTFLLTSLLTSAMTFLRTATLALISGTMARSLARYFDSRWSVILLPVVFLIAFHVYHILVYQRFLHPLSKVPGPKVRAF